MSVRGPNLANVCLSGVCFQGDEHVQHLHLVVDVLSLLGMTLSQRKKRQSPLITLIRSRLHKVG